MYVCVYVCDEVAQLVFIALCVLVHARGVDNDALCCIPRVPSPNTGPYAVRGLPMRSILSQVVYSAVVDAPPDSAAVRLESKAAGTPPASARL